MLGAHAHSNTGSMVLVTVELLPKHTDMKGITIYHGKSIINPFYRPLKVNAGKIVRITDLEEKDDFTDAIVNDEYHIYLNKYFYLTDDAETTGHEPKEIDQEEYLTAYQYKIAVLEQSEYVARGYTGTVYKHYPSGNIATKRYYKDGNIHSRFYHRDDTYNTLEAVRQYRPGTEDETIDCELLYDTREALIHQQWYNSKGKLYHKINTQTKSRSNPTPDTEDQEEVVEETVIPEPAPVQESEDDASDDIGPNLGTDVGGVRFKPKDEDFDEPETEDTVSESSA